jgi:protein-S-isoprenylcysteine O-methyltransferase
MTPIRLMWLCLGLSWLGAEVLFARRVGGDGQSPVPADHDQGSFQWMWLAAVIGLAAALLFKELRWLPLSLEGLTRQAAALALFGAGGAVRLWAITSLGPLFDTRVTLHDQHRLIRSGPYRWVRHPSYSGLLLALTGAGVAMGDWLALTAITLPIAAALRVRIKLEEQALASHFPSDYADYRRRSWMLIPWIC